MEITMVICHTIDEYIAQYPENIREILQSIRETIRSAAPESMEKISYGMPTFFCGENLIHFAVAKRHIGIYPTSSGVFSFAERLTAYKTSRGAIQLPLNQPIPYDLIRDITAFRVAQARGRNKPDR
jgi:uncharacterized protein YdhG (YjbR/CyaY superfamily)